MANLTVNVFWLSFMPIYQHSIGGITIVLSALAFYLMAISILIVDLVSSFLVCPLFLSPLLAIFCMGLLCGTGVGREIAVVLLMQCVVQVAITVTFALHFKYTTVVEMTRTRKVTTIEKAAFRLIFWSILELPVAALFVVREGMMEIRDFLLHESQLILFALVENRALFGVGYSIPEQFLLPTAALFGVPIAVTVIVCAFCVRQSLKILSVQSPSMSERTRKMQQKLTHTLIMQLSIPLVIQVCPMVTILFTFMNMLSPGSTNTVLCVQQCHAIVHTVFLILTTPSYRDAILRRTTRQKSAVFTTIIM